MHSKPQYLLDVSGCIVFQPPYVSIRLGGWMSPSGSGRNVERQ